MLPPLNQPSIRPSSVHLPANLLHGATQPCWLEAGIALLDSGNRIVEANNTLTEWLHLSSNTAAVGQKLDLLLTDRCAQWGSAWLKLENSSLTIASAQWRIPGIGSESDQWFSVQLVRHTGGKVFRIDSAPRPLDQFLEHDCERCLASEPARRETFFRLVRASEQLTQLMTRWPGIVFSQRPDGSFYYVSPKIEEITGIPVSEWERTPDLFWSVIHEADLANVRAYVKEVETSSGPLTLSVRVRHVKTGKVSYIEEHRQAVHSRSGGILGYEGVWLDNTRQTLVEKRLNAAAWKEMLSLLTMGLAHDFRNVMSGVITLTDTFLSQVTRGHSFYEGLSLIRSNAWQATRSVQEILQLYHGKSGDPQYADVNELVRELRDMCGKMLSRKIRLKVDLSEGCLPVFLDPFEFRQAFLNLAVNARDAMPEGGDLEVQTSRHESVPSTISIRGKVPRMPAICVAVRDTGSGIPADIINSIFDPFFTTKGFDKGSGLGLYNVLNFVEKNNGAISVESEQGKGAIFRMWLPQADFTEDHARAEAARPSRTLLVFGEPGEILESTAALLRGNGFEVVVSTTLSEAWTLLHARNQRFEAVLMQTTAKCPAFFADIRNERLPVKTILQVAGCNQDELETSFLANADLVISPETTAHDIPVRIRSLLPAVTGQ
jgi:signal transduction histidine kinase